LIVVTVILYIIGIILAAAILLCLFLLLVPIRYKVSGEYENAFLVDFNIRISPLFIAVGTWKSTPEVPMQARLVIFGIPLPLHPEKWGKKENEKKEKKKEKGRKNHFSEAFRILDRGFIKSGTVLIRDLLKLLQPARIEIKGRLGFEEPHLTGWLAALNGILEGCCSALWLDIEPVWDEENHEISILVEGRLVAGAILLRVARFLLVQKSKQIFARIKRKNAPHALPN
jgi:hypothetical protein